MLNTPSSADARQSAVVGSTNRVKGIGKKLHLGAKFAAVSDVVHSVQRACFTSLFCIA